jgi:hypothetical protein
MAKRHLLALAAGLAVAGASLASAATLGGLTAHSLGASDTVVAACQTSGSIGVAFSNAYDATAKKFVVSSVNLSGIASACDGKTMTVALAKGATALDTQTVTVALTSGAQSVSVAAGVAAQDVDHTAIVIEG